MISVSLNNEIKQLPANVNLFTALTEHWGYQLDVVAVAINKIFVPKARYQEVILQANDLIDLVSPMQGG